ncbi:SDR family oxidoreductase [Flavobacterium sp. Fl-77]|uniref:SDR family oxidoreductase n=1 Tax=Flavobacterium flavipigmentatum TaxID=2893884 RepID=A0AAJ2SGD1_9FLAO|nr:MULTISPECIES: SDR family oxidoreductase [unclassified Flavobacterium]MDX6182514.1 SDR family oxidoreductase [Flavobacterium sp. Fl-33]MDX6185573.1 SDR family oxidoreductase [Flavobacterium sp. Fl-77]UFH38761.1 SDR family oxidoreductase [Flavobacterium sp. F-70]
MKILLTGATGYIGKRLLPILVAQGHHVICCVRDKNRFYIPEDFQQNLEVIEVDFLEKDSLKAIPEAIDAAFYLIHSMSGPDTNYDELESQSAANFIEKINQTQAQQIVYLSGIVNDKSLSKHLSSRKNVETILSQSTVPLTTLRAGIIVGSGSASFEIIRDLVNKLPVMITPKWLNTKCQPIAINDVLEFLSKALLNPATYHQNFDIGGPDILTYKEMLLGFAEAKRLKRYIFTVPVMTPKLSSYWLYFVTSTSYKLASALVSSMKVEVVCSNQHINKLLNVTPMTYKEALSRALQKVDEDKVASSWKDSLVSGRFKSNISGYLKIPKKDCFIDRRKKEIVNLEYTINKIWAIGGENGWYYGDWLWSLRGFIDKLFGGVGSRRGRTHKNQIYSGDALDFWRVLYANKEEGKLILYAEMKLPGEAWLEFKIIHNTLYQAATFRPKGFLGKLYWYSVLPFHGFIFNGMLNKLIKE